MIFTIAALLFSVDVTPLAFHNDEPPEVPIFKDEKKLIHLHLTSLRSLAIHGKMNIQQDIVPEISRLLSDPLARVVELDRLKPGHKHHIFVKLSETMNNKILNLRHFLPGLLVITGVSCI